jgi:hypothetical protein
MDDNENIVAVLPHWRDTLDIAACYFSGEGMEISQG